MALGAVADESAGPEAGQIDADCDAVAEATREGAPPIDLIDGDRLADMLKALKLGVRTEMVERVVVDEDWLGSL